ncbi:hypothetical protein ES703_83071 [subsurface metagenome]
MPSSAESTPTVRSNGMLYKLRHFILLSDSSALSKESIGLAPYGYGSSPCPPSNSAAIRPPTSTTSYISWTYSAPVCSHRPTSDKAGSKVKGISSRPCGQIANVINSDYHFSRQGILCSNDNYSFVNHIVQFDQAA